MIIYKKTIFENQDEISKLFGMTIYKKQVFPDITKRRYFFNIFKTESSHFIKSYYILGFRILKKVNFDKVEEYLDQLTHKIQTSITVS